MQDLEVEFLVSRVSTLLPYEVGTCIVKAVYALIVNYSKYRLGVLPSILDDCIIEEILIIIYCWADLFGSCPSPLYLFAIVDVLG